MVLIKNAVIAVVIILSGVITSIVVGVAAFVILVSVVIGGLVCISVVVDTKVVMLINSSLPSTMVIVKGPMPEPVKPVGRPTKMGLFEFIMTAGLLCPPNAMLQSCISKVRKCGRGVVIGGKVAKIFNLVVAR